ncbi:spore germination protein [Paenibacillus sp. 1001270B_150601_E10]|uniref:spore germination protein n=1 Tax=Paenibacillus sp. 1001270B_150601_E10 TaxID=2787079 RepID=UPI00189D351B|nr:spore germination protein [Paenibacillus sp. 1001270B_150601_E10]
MNVSDSNLQQSKQSNSNENSSEHLDSWQKKQSKPMPITSKDLDYNLEYVRKQLGHSSDVVSRQFVIHTSIRMRAAILYIDGLANQDIVQEDIIQQLMKDQLQTEQMSREQILRYITEHYLPIGGVQMVKDWNTLISNLLLGQSVLMLHGTNQMVSMSTIGGNSRSVDEPQTDVVIRGPREGFNEILRTNTSMIRRRIRNPNLWQETMQIGEITQTNVAIMYMKGIAREEVINEVRSRLKKIKIDAVLESGYIEKCIEDQNLTPFPTIVTTERPDSAAANLLEGKIVILVDGTPFALIAPVTFNQFFQVVEDYYSRFDIATALRFLRLIIFTISMLGPSLYIAATTFHQEMIPTWLLISLLTQLESTPFSGFTEALLMEIMFEILREAGVRLPKAIGPAVSIVGALVIGQASVQAGLVSPAMVIVVSVTAISSFATPSFSLAISARLLRFVLMISAATLGLYGILMTLIIVCAHLCSLRSFGVPFMSPFTSTIRSDHEDTLFFLPRWLTYMKPKLSKSNSPKS